MPAPNALIEHRHAKPLNVRDAERRCGNQVRGRPMETDVECRN